MKFIRYSILFIIFLSALAFKEKNNIIYTVSADYIEGCETGKGECNPITLIRSSITDSITVIFPSGGTQTDAYLYSYNDTTINFEKLLLHDEKWLGEGRPKLDLTGLADGTYHARMIGCGLGGSFKLIIETEKK